MGTVHRRPLHAAAGAFTALHQAVELAFGTGVIGQSAVGLRPAIAASVVFDGGWVYLAGRRRTGPVLAFLAGVGIGVPAVHFRLWPWRLRPVPVLTEAEGLPRRLMPAYNAILYGWALAAGLALVRETPRRERLLAVPGILSVFAAGQLVRRHFEWMGAEASRNPQWWNAPGNEERPAGDPLAGASPRSRKTASPSGTAGRGTGCRSCP